MIKNLPRSWQTLTIVGWLARVYAVRAAARKSQSDHVDIWPLPAVPGRPRGTLPPCDDSVTVSPLVDRIHGHLLSPKQSTVGFVLVLCLLRSAACEYEGVQLARPALLGSCAEVGGPESPHAAPTPPTLVLVPWDDGAEPLLGVRPHFPPTQGAHCRDEHTGVSGTPPKGHVTAFSFNLVFCFCFVFNFNFY